jgi:nitrite reductase/ring-hydroxylating ferredoxin subunit
LKVVGQVSRARLVAGELVRLEYPPWHVLVAWADGGPYAIEDACNHAGASLAEGTRDGDCVACPHHGYLFSLKTGALLAPRGLCDNQRCFVTRVEGENVVVYDPFELRIDGSGATGSGNESHRS